MGTSARQASNARIVVRAAFRLAWAIPIYAAVTAASFAHGTHANIVSPVERAKVVKTLDLHVEETPERFPYVHVTIRNAEDKDKDEVWSGLLPLGDNGYFERVDLNGWKPGAYIAEVQFLGDIVEQVQRRAFMVLLP